MANHKNSDQTPIDPSLIAHLEFLKLSFMQANYDALANLAAQKNWTHVDYLAALAEGEAGLRRERSIQRRIRLARFPVIKTLEHYGPNIQLDFTFPTGRATHFMT